MKIASYFLNVALLTTVLFLWLRKDCDNINANYSGERFKGISIDLARQIAEHYGRDNGKRLIENGGQMTGMEDTRSVWFSLETLKKFIWHIEHAACNQGCNGNIRLGVRIYFAKYPDSIAMANHDELKDLNPLFAQHHTLFMVPTYETGSGNADFNPWNWGNDKCNPISVKDRLNPSFNDTRKMKMLILAVGEEQNHGDLAPPPSGTGIFGTY